MTTTTQRMMVQAARARVSALIAHASAENTRLLATRLPRTAAP
jgi:hypothetical protein